MKTNRWVSCAAGSWGYSPWPSPVAHHPTQPHHDPIAAGAHQGLNGRDGEERKPEPDTRPDWTEPMLTCLRRIRRWRIPANWSVPDWLDEMRSVGMLAAIEAAGVFDTTRGLAFDAFVRSRVLARALTFYRQEWNYAARHIDGVSLPEEQERLLPDQLRFAPDNGDHLACMSLREGLALLPEQCAWLLKELYLHERTVAEVARHLGIGQRAVNKRKHVALRHLRQHLDAVERNLA